MEAARGTALCGHVARKSGGRDQAAGENAGAGRAGAGPGRRTGARTVGKVVEWAISQIPAKNHGSTAEFPFAVSCT